MVPVRNNSKVLELSPDELVFSKHRSEDAWARLLQFASLKDIKSEVTAEMYGIGSTVRALCFLPRWFPLRFKNQHGVSLWEVPPEHELNSPERYLFVHSKRWKEIFLRHGKANVIVTGSFFVAYRKYLLGKNIVKKKWTNKPIFFLSHSTFWEKAEWEASKLIECLERIRDKEGGLTVCVHFVDILNGSAKPIFDAGFDVAIAGHYYNSCFTKNFYRLLLNHEIVYTNAMGSHVAYAVEADKEVRWIDLPVQYSNIGYKEKVWDDVSRERPIETEFVRALRAGVDGREILCSLSRSELGLDSMIARTELFRLVVFSTAEWWMKSIKEKYWRICKNVCG